MIVQELADREGPWEECERYAGFWHDSRLLSTQGLGHNRIVDDPGVIDAAVRFLRGSPVGERVVSTPDLPYGTASTVPGRPLRPVPANDYAARTRRGDAVATISQARLLTNPHTVPPHAPHPFAHQPPPTATPHVLPYP